MSQVNDSSRNKYWRSFAELEDDPEFREMVTREWRVPLDQEPGEPARRRFLQIMGASFAFAGLATGCHWKEDKLVDFAKRPENLIPGEPRYYATTMEIAGDAVGLVATSADGRPVKIEGNPAHPASRGAAGVWHQASLLGLYDPDRSQRLLHAGKAAEHAELSSFVSEQAKVLAAAGGKGLWVLSGRSSSPTLEDMKKRLVAKYPAAKWVEYEPIAGDEVRLGTKLAFGKPQRVHIDVARADLVLSLDGDFIGPGFPMWLANARALAATRMPDSGKMSRLYVVESSYSHAGSVADHRLPLRAELVKAFAAALDAQVSAAAGAAAEFGPAQPKPGAKFLTDAKVDKFLQVVAKDLVEHRGRCLIVAGLHQPPEVHALAARLNSVLGNVGNTVWYTEESDPERPAASDQLKELVSALSGGSVELLLVLAQNPVFTAPSDLGYAAAHAKAKTSIALSDYVDETAKASTWHVPHAHWLETWSDTLSHDGTLAIAQPLIAPLFAGKSAPELLSLLTEASAMVGKDLVRRTHQAAYADARRWKRLVHDGAAVPAPADRTAPKLEPQKPVSFDARELGGLELANGELELVLAADAKIYDGRWANNAWLQELPEPFTKLSWQNAALFAPETAKAVGVTDGTPVRLSVNGASIELPAMVIPGQAPGSVKVTLGYGRLSAGVVGGNNGDVTPTDPVGANAYLLRSTKLHRFGGGLQVASLGEAQKLPTTQDVHAIDAVGSEGREERVPNLVREGTLEEFKKTPEFAKQEKHHAPLLNLWTDPIVYDGHKWGMTVDLGKCIGCNACVTACQAENNVAVVGRENVMKGREMLWLRVDRYYRGEPEEAEVSWQPMPCQQCENAPCEQVCPVGATMHSKEGLNDMVYNRCIGTRYCANNCPYKVRRFNYFNYHLDKVGPTPWHGSVNDRQRVRAMVFNPEVTVRARGVMEKCTFCVQRIQSVKIKAKNAKRQLTDGEIRTACQQTCPTQAISFGDLNDNSSEVTKLSEGNRGYKLLDELNDRPRVTYLARVKNPNPELG
jgi:MoCo/4Fe-4S cofactor protein with predicted Tat translocation signal